MARDPFDEVIQRTLAELPAPFRDRLDNVQVAVEDEWDEDPDTYGLYEGVPLTERADAFDGFRPPDLVRIFRRPLEEDFGDRPAELARQVRVTLLHELAHHFGIDDARLTELGWA
ncbi:MAG: hypothetical protein JWM98_2564 [Thermoleophilia bacterium]|nr:hypothetical protein [Thermoleophilia bacterium]